MRPVFGKIFHITGLLCVLILPIGYYTGGPDSSQVSIGAYGGAGQVATVLRDCSGKALASKTSPFSEASGSIHYALPKTFPLVIGIRGGYYKIDARIPVKIMAGSSNNSGQYIYSTRPHWTIRENYMIQEASIEAKSFGLGLGIVSGQIPMHFGQILEDHSNTLSMTGHMRIGDINQTYMILSMGEGNPILSDGLYLIGVGGRVSRNVMICTGASFGYYDRGGFFQQVSVRTGRHLDIDCSVRIGGADGKFEGAFNLGLTFRFGTLR